MPRTWGYIIIAAAALIGVGALVIPLPEGVDIEPIAVPAVKKPAKSSPSPTPRNAARPKAAPKKPTPPPTKEIPRSDTTKARTLIKPPPKP
jgi:hypothetical protein